MSLLGSSVDGFIDDSGSSVLPGVEHLLRMHASASQNWRCLIEIENFFVSGHIHRDEEDEDELWYDSLEDLQRYERRAKGALHMGKQKEAVTELSRLAGYASNLPDVEWVQIKRLYQRAINISKSADLMDKRLSLQVSLTIAAIENEVSKSEIISLWDSMMNSWNGESDTILFSNLHSLAEVSVESSVVQWAKISELYQEMISVSEDANKRDLHPKLYWQFAELAENSEIASSTISSELYSKAIKAFKSPSNSVSDNAEFSRIRVDKTGKAGEVEQKLSLDWEETKHLYQGVICRKPRKVIHFRDAYEGEGFSAEYTPLCGISDDDLKADTTKEDLLKYLNASPEWVKRRKAQNHLVDLRNSDKEQLEEKYCPSGYKKELIQLLVRECGAGVFSGGFRPKTLAELVGCSEGYAQQIAFRNPAEEVRGNERTEVLENDDGVRKKNQCAACSEDSPLQVHHIIPISDGGSKDMENLATLCRSCHREVHSGTWGPIIYDTVDEFWDWVENHPLQ